ncbi:FadR/GntR family transcriptional regulator [Paenibacillus piri]|nr:FadR/GntR family transcriptional regulator [Paenibacillus piri]
MPVQKQRVYQMIIEQIKTSIERGELHPGDRLPSERDLAEALSVSRSAVREAVSVLESARIVKIAPGIGVFLEEDRNKDVLAKLNEIVSPQNTNLIELIEVRQAMEVQAAYLAALRRTDADLRAIQSALDALERSVKAGQVAAEEDYLFHLRVVEAAGNQMLMESVKFFSDKCLAGLHESRSQSLGIPGKSRAVLEEHQLIYSAIEQRNADRARDMMWEHLQNVKARYLS